jgi:serine/threonine protein phosphatase PrpC
MQKKKMYWDKFYMKGKRIMKKNREIEYELLTNVANRENNEDYVGMKQCDSEFCFILADGLGGHGKGEIASQLVVNEGLEHFEKNYQTEDCMNKIFEISQDKLIEKQKEEHEINGMKTTMVVLQMKKDIFRWGHVGDSRLYYFKKNKIVKRTIDHSVPQMLVEAGEIKEKDIRNHPDRNRLLRVMGILWDEPRYELDEWEKYTKGKRQAFLLCTDGFWELLSDKDMEETLRKSKTVKEWLSKMEEIVLNNGKNVDMDNYSAIGVFTYE